MSAPGVVYVTSNYPAVSHTFILREIRALRDLGLPVEPISVRRAPVEDVLSEVDRDEFRRTYALLPTTAGRVVRDHLRALRRSPRGYGGTLLTALRLSHGGARATLWQLFYFVEAIMAWSYMDSKGVRHLHAHHANVACDVALLASAFGNAARRSNSAAWSWTFTLHGPTELYDVTGHKLVEKVSRSSGVAATSDYMHSQLMNHLGPDQWEKVRVVRGGVDPSEFAPQGETAASTGLPLRVLNVGRLAAQKGQVELLRGIAELVRRGVPVSAVIVGDGPLRPTIEREIRRLDLGQVVTLAGAVSPTDVHQYYAAADVFCLPSYAEGLPNVLMEAMAMEIAVVSTRVMGIPELVEPGISGVLVAPARADLLADALQALAEDPELRRRLARAGRARVVADYQIERTAREMHELIEHASGSPTA